MKSTLSFLPVLVLALVSVAPAQRTYVLLSEDFEELALGPKVDETQPGDAVWTKTPPAGWTIDDTGVPGAGTTQDGVTEWEAINLVRDFPGWNSGLYIPGRNDCWVQGRRAVGFAGRDFPAIEDNRFMLDDHQRRIDDSRPITRPPTLPTMP